MPGTIQIRRICLFCLITFPLLLSYVEGESQKLLFKDIENYLNCSKTDCFTNSIESHGFCYDQEKKDSFETYTSCEFFYFKDIGDKTIKTKNYVSFGTKNFYCLGKIFYCVCLTVVTSSQEYYQELLNQLLSEGFKEISSTSALRKFYKSPKHAGIELEIVIEDKIVADVGNYPVYNIYFKKPLKK